MPPWTFAGIPGWLAFSTLAADAQGDPWTPRHPNRAVTAAILNADAWAERLDEGTSFDLLAREGRIAARLSEVSPIPFGCDGNPMAMASFQAPVTLAEQAVWVMPGDLAEARSIPIAEPRPAQVELREFEIAGHQLRLTRTSDTQGQLTVLRDGAQVYAQAFEKHFMDGAEETPLDLSYHNEIGVPTPVGAWAVDATTGFVVLRVMSYEGVGFELLRLDATPRSAGEVSYYLCAF